VPALLIAFDNSAQAGPVNVSPFVVPFTCFGNMLIVGIQGNSISSCTFNGVAMTPAAGSPISHLASGSLTVFYLANPTQGTHNVQAVLSGGGNSYMVIGSYFFSDPTIEAVSIDVTSTAGAGAAAPYTINPAINTLTVGDWIVTLTTANATWTAHAGTNLRQTTTSGLLLADRGPLTPAGAYGTTVDTNFNGGVPIASYTLALKPFVSLPLEQRIRIAAAAYSPLALLLGSGSPLLFRWYNGQLVQGSAYPAVVAMTVTNPPSYIFNRRLSTSYSLMQYTIWGGVGSAGAQAAEDVSAAMATFFDQLDLVGNGRQIQQNNFIQANRQAYYPQGTTLIYQRVLEVRVFSDDTK